MKWYILNTNTNTSLEGYCWNTVDCDSLGLDAKKCAEKLANRLNFACGTYEWVAVERD